MTTLRLTGTYLLLVLLLLLLATVAVATVRHRRYLVSPDLLQMYVPPYAVLPGRYAQEAVYRDALEWLEEARSRGIRTWLTGESLEASRRVHGLYPWATKITFAYVHSERVASKWPHSVELRSHVYLPEQRLDVVRFGLLPRVHAPLPETGRVAAAGPIGPVTTKRRDLLDRFRYPFGRTSDTFYAYTFTPQTPS